MSAPRSFQMAAKATTAKRDAEYEPRDYLLVSEDGTETTITAHYPGDGVLTLLMATSVADESDETVQLNTLFGLIEQTFSAEDYKFIRAKLRSEELTIDVVMDIIMDAIEGWTSFPTKPSSASTGRRQPTGTRSTGRVRGSVSTPSPSLPAGS